MRIQSLFKDPLIHFLCLGILLFIIFEFKNNDTVESNANEILITKIQLKNIYDEFKEKFNRAPTKKEFDHKLAPLIKTEVLYREGIALGLDQNDDQVKLRVADKMRYLSEDIAELIEPSEQELTDYLKENAFKMEATIYFEHLFFSPNRNNSREQLIIDSTDILAKLNQGAAPITVVGAARLSSNKYVAAKLSFVTKAFGSVNFTDYVFNLPSDNKWYGPIESKFGIHLVNVSKITPENDNPILSLVRKEVEQAYITRQKGISNELEYKKLSAKYKIKVDMPATLNFTAL